MNLAYQGFWVAPQQTSSIGPDSLRAAPSSVKIKDGLVHFKVNFTTNLLFSVGRCSQSWPHVRSRCCCDSLRLRSQSRPLHLHRQIVRILANIWWRHCWCKHVFKQSLQSGVRKETSNCGIYLSDGFDKVNEFDRMTESVKV